MGTLTARVVWNGDARGETETMWMSPKPTWFVNNKFNCRRAGLGDTLTVELVKKSPKKRGAVAAAAAGPGTGDVLGSVQLGWEEVKDAVLGGDKCYFDVVATSEYRATAPNARIGLKIH